MNAPSVAEDRPAGANSALAGIGWTSAATLALTLVLTQALMMLNVLAGRPGGAWVAPAALLGALFLGDRLAVCSGHAPRIRRWAAGVSLGVVGLALALAAWHFDLSVDGQWYHQTAIYAIARDWNPLAEPMREFHRSLQLWVAHYPKGTWYFGAAVLGATGDVEWGKCQAGIAWAAMLLATLAAGREFGLARGRSLALAVVVALNPVVTSVLTAFLVEAVLASFLTVTVVAVLCALRRPDPVIVATASAAAIITINAKLTGLVYVCVVAAAGALWCLWRRRPLAGRFIGWSAGVLVLGAGVFGYNPYVTNTMHRGHPFYPVLGTAKHPSLMQQGKEGIERFETPKNLLPLNRVARIGYALFGRPGNAPYAGQRNAELMWPLGVHREDLRWYHYHETRVAGFGPFFSAAVLLGVALGGWLFWRQPEARAPLALLVAMIAGSLLLSIHSWWARYSPQIWLLAVLPAAFAFRPATPPALMRGAWVLVVLLLVDGAVVAGVRTGWEARSSQTLRAQMTELRNAGRLVELDEAWYPVAVPERFRRWDIPFVRKPRKEMGDSRELMSIVEGYPAFLGVRYRYAPAGPVPDAAGGSGG